MTARLATHQAEIQLLLQGTVHAYGERSIRLSYQSTARPSRAAFVLVGWGCLGGGGGMQVRSPGVTLPLTTIQQDSSSACFETCRMLYSFMAAAPGPASTPPAVGACCAGCGAAATPAGFTMKLLAASDALLLLERESCCCCSGSAARADKLVESQRWCPGSCGWLHDAAVHPDLR